MSQSRKPKRIQIRPSFSAELPGSWPLLVSELADAAPENAAVAEDRLSVAIERLISVCPTQTVHQLAARMGGEVVSSAPLPGEWDELIDGKQREPLCAAIRDLIAVNDRLMAESRANGAGLRAATQALRIAALIELMQEARIERTSATAYKRVLKALKVLGFTPEEGAPVLYRLDYHERDGKPQQWLINKMQKGKKK